MTNHLHQGDLPSGVDFGDAVAVDSETMGLRVGRDPLCVVQLSAGDGDAHIAEAVPMMRAFPPAMRMSLGHHADVGQAVERVLDAASPSHRIYNVVDDEAPDLVTLFASVGAPPPDGSAAERARAFDVLLDGNRIREDLGFRPEFPRLRDAIAAGRA